MTNDELQAIKARAEAATPDAEFIAHARTDVPDLVADVRRAVEVIRAIVDASDDCQGHADCAHSMKPWFDARELLYQFDNDSEALANLQSRRESYLRRPGASTS